MGQVISWTTIQQITLDDERQEGIKQQILNFDMALHERLDDGSFTIDINKNIFYIEDKEQCARDDMESTTPEIEDDKNYYNKYINSKVSMMENDTQMKGTVLKRARGIDGRPIGRFHTNPRIDTAVYKVE